MRRARVKDSVLLPLNVRICGVGAPASSFCQVMRTRTAMLPCRYSVLCQRGHLGLPRVHLLPVSLPCLQVLSHQRRRRGGPRAGAQSRSLCHGRVATLPLPLFTSAAGAHVLGPPNVATLAMWQAAHVQMLARVRLWSCSHSLEMGAHSSRAALVGRRSRCARVPHLQSTVS